MLIVKLRERRMKMENKEKIGFVDRLVEKLPRIHIAGYKYCGPNTNLKSLLARGEVGINKLDCACMDHDIAYAESKDCESRRIADKLLLLKAFRRLYAKDSRIGERLAALLVTGLISIKLILDRIESFFINIRNCIVKRKSKSEN